MELENLYHINCRCSPTLAITELWGQKRIDKQPTQDAFCVFWKNERLSIVDLPIWIFKIGEQKARRN